MSINQANGAAAVPGNSLDTIVNYGGRQIDIRPFLGLNDYWMRAVCDPRDRSLLWFRHGFSETEIVRLPWDGTQWDEAQAEALAPYGRRSCWQATFNEHHGSMFVIADEENNETLNIYRFTPGDGGLTQVSRIAYTVGYAFSPVRNRLVFVGRKDSNSVDTFLFEMDPDDDDSLTVLHADVPDHRLNVFVAPVVDASDRRIAVTILNNNRHQDMALGIYRREEGRLEVIDPPGERRAMVAPLGWRGDELLLIADMERKKQEVWVYDDASGKMSRLFANPGISASGLFDADSNRLILQLESDEGKELVLVDAQTGSVLRSQPSDGCEFLWLLMSSTMGSGEYVVSTRTSSSRVIAGVVNLNDDAETLMRPGFEPAVLETMVSSCEMHDVSYTTFDLDEHGVPRKIHGVLFLPKKMPRIPSKQAAIIYAHGGPTSQTTKSWSPSIQFLCSLGYIVFGPNPRGSSGKGKTFEQLNDQDWGGADFRDYCQGLLYLLRKFGLSPRRVGMLGGSYGGYMTNWALTRPNTPFAFGISVYGISDLLLTIRKSVIAGMTFTEMGDPESDPDIMQQYIERSPITWAEHLASPMLLIHGSQDNRTATDQSRLFHKKLQALNKDVAYVEIEGEGHGFKTVRAQVESMQAMADFLWRIAPILSEEELEREDMLEELHAELLDVVHAALDAAADPTDEKQREIQSRFDQTRQRIWERAKELRASDEPINLPASAD